MTLLEALALLSPTQRNDAETVLTAWTAAGGTASQASTNFQNETALDDRAYAALLKSLIQQKAGLDPVTPNTGRAFKDTTAQHFLKGIFALVPTAAGFGRAIIFEKYVRYAVRTLREDLGYDENEDSVREALLEIHAGSIQESDALYEHYFWALRRTLLGKDVIFATFEDGRPFFAAPLDSADNIRNALGLGCDDVNQTYILLPYSIPPKVPLYVPTVADANWDYQLYFRPNPSAQIERRGWTLPLSPSSSIQRQPEIVHEEIDGATLIFPFKITK